MTLFLISWFTFSYSFPLNFNIGVRHDVASSRSVAEKIINQDGVYMVKVSLIKDGRVKPVKLAQRLED